jgi:Homoserine dehydrogenase
MSLHLFIAGTGGVGKALLQQIREKQGFLYQSQGVSLELNGLLNSRKMLLSRQPVSLDKIEELSTLPLAETPSWQEADLEQFIGFIQRLQIPDAVFVDLTAHANVAACYLPLLQRGIHVVACNKIACSAPLAHYNRLLEASESSGARFLYNTNVGAALPYLQAVKQLYQAGEKIYKIEAVLSGTLSYIFERYDASLPLAAIVRQAQEAGYTEPDPRIDLQGIDVMRKLLILCREAGIPLEEQQIQKDSFLPPGCTDGGLGDFYACLEQNEAHFAKLYTQAREKGGKLKYIASYDSEGKQAGIGLHCVTLENPIYHIGPKDNILLVHSSNYLSPLSIVGAGAGASGTAMGVLSDILQCPIRFAERYAQE